MGGFCSRRNAAEQAAEPGIDMQPPLSAAEPDIDMQPPSSLAATIFDAWLMPFDPMDAKS